MPILTTVSFNGLDVSESPREAAIEHAQRLERFAGDISHCEVTFRADTSRRQRPQRYSVQVSVLLRGRTIGTHRGGIAGEPNEDIRITLSRAFDSLTRRIEDYVRRRRGDVKTHTPLYPVL